MNRVEVLETDITKLEVDVIVNAANERMLGGGGVDGAIHAAAGPGLAEECARVPEVRPGVRCPTGEARITGGHDLPARWVVHTVGPVWKGGHAAEPVLLARCYTESLRLAVEHGARSIAFPAIATGVFGYPVDQAAKVAVGAVARFLAGDRTLDRVILTAFGPDVARALDAALAAQRAAGGVRAAADRRKDG